MQGIKNSKALTQTTENQPREPHRLSTYQQTLGEKMHPLGRFSEAGWDPVNLKLSGVQDDGAFNFRLPVTLRG